jgi:hypothetical protein
MAFFKANSTATAEHCGGSPVAIIRPKKNEFGTNSKIVQKITLRPQDSCRIWCIF